MRSSPPARRSPSRVVLGRQTRGRGRPGCPSPLSEPGCDDGGFQSPRAGGIPPAERRGESVSAELRFAVVLGFVASDAAIDLIHERGGRLYVWVKKGHCCRAPRSLNTARTEPPAGADHGGFRSVATGNGSSSSSPATWLRYPTNSTSSFTGFRAASRPTGTASPGSSDRGERAAGRAARHRPSPRSAITRGAAMRSRNAIGREELCVLALWQSRVKVAHDFVSGSAS